MRDIHFFSTSDDEHIAMDRSAIDKMKEEKRAAAAAKRAAAPAPATDSAAEPMAAAPAPAAAASGPLAQLAAAEAKAEQITKDIASITVQATEAADADALDAVSKLAASMGGAVGGLQGEQTPSRVHACERARPSLPLLS